MGEPKPVEPKSCDEWSIFRVFTACPGDAKTLLLDVRPHKDFKKKHINQAYCVRLSANGAYLADYSQCSYATPWSQDVWWGCHVILYGGPGLSREHAAARFLASQGRCLSVSVYKPGYDAFEARFPYLCTTSVKANSIKKFPSAILPGLLYLGDWGDAEAHERLAELGIKRVLTIHNHPERLKLPPSVQHHLKIELADVEGAAISEHFNASFEFLADAERLKQPALVHCGAGVSRSACLVIMFLMRSRLMSAKAARDLVIGARSIVTPNDGFWHLLCALEGPLGISNRTDADATSMGFAGADALPEVQLDEAAAGQPVPVLMVSLRDRAQAAALQEKAAALAAQATEAQAAAEAAMAAERSGGQAAQQQQQPKLARGRAHSRSRSRERRRGSSRSRSRDWRVRHGSGSRERQRRRSRSRERSGRQRDRRRSRSRSRERRSNGRPEATAPSAAQAAAAAAAVASAAAAAAAAAAANAAAKLELPAAAGPGWRLALEVSRPEGPVGELHLGPMSIHQRVVFGRAPSCSVVLEHLSISRQHAQLAVDNAGTVLVTDLGSGHGTKLEDTWLKANAPRSLAVGARLRFGASTRAYKLVSVDKVAQG